MEVLYIGGPANGKVHKYELLPYCNIADYDYNRNALFEDSNQPPKLYLCKYETYKLVSISKGIHYYIPHSWTLSKMFEAINTAIKAYAY